MDIVWEDNKSQPNIVWDGEDTDSGEITGGEALKNVGRAASAMGRTALGMGGSVAMGAPIALGNLVAGGSLEDAAKGIEEGGRLATAWLPEPHEQTQKAMEGMSKAFEKFVEIGGDAGVKLLEQSIPGRILKQNNPVKYDEVERAVRGVGEVGSQVIGLEEGLRAARPGKPKPVPEGSAPPMKAEVDAFLAARAEAEKADSIKAQIAMEVRGKREGEMMDLRDMEQLQTQGKVDIPLETAEAHAPNTPIFDWEFPADPAVPKVLSKEIAWEKPGLELAQEPVAARPVDMIDPGMLNAEGAAARSERVQRIHDTREGSRPISDVIRDMRAEQPLDRPPQPSFGEAVRTDRPDLTDTSAFDPFREKTPGVEKTMTAEEFRKQTLEENLAGRQAAAGGRRIASKERGSAGEPQWQKVRRAMESEDPPVGAAFADTATGRVAGPFLTHHSDGIGWLKRVGESMGFKYQNLRNGFVTKSGKFVTREEALANWGANISEMFPFKKAEPTVTGKGHTDVPYASPRDEARAIGAGIEDVTTKLDTAMANMRRIGKGQRGMLDMGAIVSGIFDKHTGKNEAPIPTKGEYGNFRDALPEELKPKAKELYDQFKQQKARETRSAVVTPTADSVPAHGLFEGLRGFVPTLKSFEEVLPALKNSKDIFGGVTGDALNAAVAGGKMKSQLSRSDVVKYGVDMADNAVKTAQAKAHNTLFDKNTGILSQIGKLSKKEQTHLMGVIHEFDGVKWLSTDELIRKGLNDKQIHAYESYRQGMGKVLNDVNLGRAAKGMPPIKGVEGFFPHSYVGRFYVRIEDAAGRLIRVEARQSARELKALVDHIKQAKPDFKVSDILTREDIRTWKYGGDARNTRSLFDQIAETLGRDSLEASVLKQLVEDYNAQLPGKHRFGKHLEQRAGIEGYRGNQMGSSVLENLKDAMHSVDGYVHDAYAFVENHAAHENIAKLVNPDNGINTPNAKAYVQKYWDHAQKIENQFTQVQRHALEAIPRALGLDPALGQRVGNQIRKQVVLSMLGYLRPSFLAAQLFQPIQMMIPALTEMRLRAKGEAYHNSLPIAMARGWMDALHPNTASKLSKEAIAFAHENGILKDTLIGEINSLNEMDQKTFIGKTWSWVNGEKPMAIAEQFARRAAYLQAVHAMEGSSLKPHEMFRAAGDVMDMAMVNYSAHEKAMGYTSMGEAGKWISPLMSFKVNWVSQRLKYMKLLAENPATQWKPFAQSLAMDVLFAGVMGTALLKEIDLGISMLKKVGLLDADTDDATGTLLKWSTQFQGKTRDVIRYGPLSGLTGFDFSPTFAMTQVLPHSVKDFLPILAKGADMMGAAAGIPSAMGGDTEAQAKVLSQIPGPAKALAESKMQDEEGMIPNPNRNMEGKVRRDTAGAVGSALGAGSIQEKEQTQAVGQSKKIEMQIQERKTKLMHSIKQGHADGKDISDGIEEYMQLGGTPREIIQALKEDQKNRNLTAYDRATLPPKNNNQRRQVMRIQEYGVRE